MVDDRFAVTANHGCHAAECDATGRGLFTCTVYVVEKTCVRGLAGVG